MTTQDLGGLVFGLLLFALYLLPTIIAGTRKHRQVAPIAVTNILAGWTGIGWLVALIWSVASFSRVERVS